MKLIPLEEFQNLLWYTEEMAHLDVHDDVAAKWRLNQESVQNS
jgi:hypothetical protein